MLAWLVLLPAAASAQAVITGTVRDSSGAVLPGVTVEATSPALIEKVRAAVSDGSGQYRIEDLRPGTYTVSFTLTGFSVFKREGIELTGSFTAVVNAEMRLGALEETIVVTGESPVVDVQSARRQMTLGSDVLRSIPTIRNYNGVVLLVPGVVTNTNDVPTGATTTQFPIHGGRNNEGRLMIDGLNIGTPVGGNQPPGYIADIGNAQEITFTTSGGLGESETAGVVMNVVPRTGGNRVIGRGLLQRHRRGTPVQQLHRRAAPRRSDRGDPTEQGLRHQRRRGRTHHAGSRLVLRQRPHAGQHARDRERVLQPERRRRDQVAVLAGPLIARRSPTAPGTT